MSTPAADADARATLRARERFWLEQLTALQDQLATFPDASRVRLISRAVVSFGMRLGAAVPE